jgi:AGCS family alanine or glycine:cation symporter
MGASDYDNGNLPRLGKVLAGMFALFTMLGSFGGGNMFQANQACAAFQSLIPALQGRGAIFGIILAGIVGVVVFGGIKGIAKVTEKIVPFMAALYLSICFVVIAMNITEIGNVILLILKGAFNPDAIKGGFIGVMILGFQRAAFSNKAGVGTAAIAHAAAKTNEPVAEGIVALHEPFVDTVVICTMTALVLIFTGYHEPPDGLAGAALTSAAFGSVVSWIPYLLTVAIFLFSFSTLLSYSYYGVKSFDYLFGGLSKRLLGRRKYAAFVFHFIFFSCIVIGSASSMGAVMDFSDMILLSMAFMNVLGLYILFPEVLRDLRSYMERLKRGEIERYK